MSQTDTPIPWHRRPIVQLVLARIREFIREPEALFWVYGFPALMVIALGIAFRNQPLKAVSVDIESGPHAAVATGSLKDATRFETEVHDADEARRRLRTGKTDVIVVVRSLNPAQIEYRFDPTRPDSVLARGNVDDALQRGLGRKDVASAADVSVTDPGARYIDFLVPGLLGMSIMGGGLWGMGFVIVDMRVRKLLKRFLATPMKRWQFLAALMISRMSMLIPEVLVLLLVARFAFGVIIFGNLLTVVFLIFLGAVTFSGIGLLVASRAKTIEAVSGLMNLIMLPMWLTSGIFFSSERFPDLVLPVIKVLPLTMLIDCLRSVMLEGATLTSHAPQVAGLLVWAVASFTLALKWFRWI